MWNLDALNPAQKEAVETIDGPLLILAGAGTGKTRVLTHRIAHLIMSNYCYPSEILAVTFTNKAAKEMSERVAGLIGGGAAEFYSGVNLGTFHSVAARILRRHAEFFSLTPSFTIIDADDQLKLVKTLLIEAGIDHKNYPPKVIAGIISRWKDLNIAYNAVSNSDIVSPAHKIAREIYTKYQKQLMQSNSVDFGDLLLYNNQLFMQSPEILSFYQNKFKYLLIDEYQDTNISQYLWARMLAAEHKNICCVGDDDQSIYSWRGAEVGNILKFHKDFPGAKIVKLEQNYRSSPNILAAASAVISHNRTRHEKTLWTEADEGELVQVISCWNDKEEASFINNEIQHARQLYRCSYSDIAVLVRAGFQTRAFEEIFIANAIPYLIVGGVKFYERMEIRDALAYIRIVLNHNDNLALERIINLPKRGIGPTTIKTIREYAFAHDISLFSAAEIMIDQGAFSPKLRQSISELLQKIRYWHEAFKTQKPNVVVKNILEESGYITALKLEQTDESRGRLENINEMLAAIEEYSNIQEFIEHTSLVMDNNETASSVTGSVSVMTLHAAKGLEFQVVFLPGWEEGLFPHQKALAEEGEKGIEEERRIAYVGITRAKKKLYISYAESRRTFGEFVVSSPSRFVGELPKNICKFSSSNNRMQFAPINVLSKTNIRYNSTPNVNAYKAREPSSLEFTGKMKPGVRVRHKIFGDGIVVRKSDDNLEIAFGTHGLKTVKESFVTVL